MNYLINTESVQDQEITCDCCNNGLTNIEDKMFETYLIYLSMAILCPLWVKSIGTKNNNPKSFWLKVLFPLIVCSIIIGGRYEVGSDWPNYFYYILGFNTGRLTSSDIISPTLEPGFMAFTWGLSCLQFGPSLYFSFIALAFFVLLLTAESDKKYLFPLLIFFFFTQAFASSMNLVRQCIATFLFLFSTRYYEKNKILMAVLLLVSISFHYSSVILLIALFIDKKLFKILDKHWVVLAVFIITYFIGSYLVKYVEMIIPTEYLSDKYLNSLSNISEEMVVSSGLGIITTKIMDGLMIVLSPKIKEAFNDKRTNILYRLYFIGIILSNIAGVSQYLSRLFLGFVMIRVFILSYACYYLINYDKDKKIIGYGLIFLGFIYLIMSVMNGNGGCSPYQFLWQ